jgi:hypothetical protein
MFAVVRPMHLLVKISPCHENLQVHRWSKFFRLGNVRK